MTNYNNSKDKHDQLPTEEHMSFSDGGTCRYYRTPGDVIDLSGDRDTSELISDNSPNIALVATEEGRFAIGFGAILMVSDIDPETKELRVLKPGSRPAKLLKEYTETGIPQLVIGSPWAVVGDRGNVTELLIEGPQRAIPMAQEHHVQATSPFATMRAALTDFVDRGNHY